MQARAESGYGWLVLSISCVLSTLIFVRHRVRWRLATPPLNLPTLNLPLSFFLVIGALARLPALFERPWYDETFTRLMASLSLEKLPTAILGDVHPPLYYGLSWVIYQLGGTSFLALRLPALLFGVLCIALVYRLTQSLGFKREAIWAAALVAFLPNAMYYSTEARQYALLAALVLGAWICILEGRKRLFILCAGLMLWTHNLGIVYLFIASLLFLLKWRDIRPVIAAGALNAVWLPFVVYQARDVSDGFWVQPISPPALLMPLVQTTYSTVPTDYLIPLYMAVITLSLYAFWDARRSIRQLHPLIALVLGAPLLLGVISWLFFPVWLPRALLPVGMGLAVFWAKATVQHRWLQPLVALLIGVGAIAFMTYERTQDYASMLSRCHRADSVLYIDVPSAFLGSAYLSDMPSVLWQGANDFNQTLSQDAKDAFGFVQGDIRQMNGYVCVVAEHNPLVSHAEQTYLTYLLTNYPHTDYRAMYSPIFGFGVYILNTGLHE